MSALLIFEHAPLGAIVSFSADLAHPSSACEQRDSDCVATKGRGRLIRKISASARLGIDRGRFIIRCASFAVGDASCSERDLVFTVDSALAFVIEETPAIGSVLVLDWAGDDATLLHLAVDHDEAEAWVRSYWHPGVILQEVSADEVAAAIVEGRAAA